MDNNNMRQCSKCKEIKDELLLFFKRKNRPSGYMYWCKECTKKYHQNYRKDNKKYKKQDKKHCIKHYQKNREYIKRRQKNYGKTLAGKITSSKHAAKRRRNLGFSILIKNPFNCDVDWHHVDDEYVIAVPKYMHQGTLGKNHRPKCNLLIEKLYDINIEKEVEKYDKKNKRTLQFRICK